MFEQARGESQRFFQFRAADQRLQGFMDVRAIYRLNEERYFRVDGGSSEPVADSASTFPESAEDFAQLDLIVLGKGAEGFLDEKRLEGLKSFVRDRGGALLLARGKSYAGHLPGLEALEPVEWGTAREGDFRFEPGSVGEAAGLFGQALPEAQDPLWRQLPALKDVFEVARVVAAPAAAAKPMPWPKDTVDQVRAVAEVLAAQATPMSVDDIAARFTARGPWKRRLPQLLEMLVAVGRAEVQGDRYVVHK